MREPAASAPCSVAFTCDSRFTGVYMSEQRRQERDELPGGQRPLADRVAAVEERTHQGEAADGLHQRRQQRPWCG